MPKTLSDSLNEFLAKQSITALLKNIAKSEVAKMLTGYKTYVVAAILLLVAALKFMGIEVPGVSDNSDPGALITMALGLIFARTGAKTEVKKLDD